MERSLPTGGTTMAKPLLDDELWEVINPLLPPPKPRRFRFPGRKPLDNRKALTGILFVLKTGIPWVVECSLSWLHQFRRLRVRYERRADIHEAFISLACCLICWSFL